MANVPVWGGFTADQAQQADINLRTQAAASPLANRLGLIMRLNESTGGFAPGSQMANIVTAIQTGQPSFIDPTSVDPRTGRPRARLLSELNGAQFVGAA